MVIYEGAVYPTQPKPLRSHIQLLLDRAAAPRIDGEVLALIVPDNNLLAGGSVAAQIYKSVANESFDTVVLISPSHSGAFEKITICSLESYHTPLGDLPINVEVCNELCDEDDDIFLDNTGHFHTAGIDVQLPFLQVLHGSFKIVPIVMGDERPAFCTELGSAVGEVMFNRRTLVVASVDIVRSTPDSLGALKSLFEAGDVQGLMALLNGSDIEVRGKGGLMVALIAALHRRARHMKVLHTDLPDSSHPGFFGAILYR
ncbi:MAG: AmmeMemoRadiSam system protein B [Rhodothermales bacterium]